MIQMGFTLLRRSTRKPAAKMRAATVSNPSGPTLSSRPPNSASTSSDSPALAIMATTAGRSPCSTPCTAVSLEK